MPLFSGSHGKVVQRASRKAASAIGMFQKAHDSLDKANAQLAVVIDRAKQEAHDKLAKARREADALLAHAEQAEKDTIANVKVQSKLTDFFRG